MLVFLFLVIKVCVCYDDLKIIGPFRAADEKEFPFMVSIQEYEEKDEVYIHKCGGFIITPHHVVTAANCVVDQAALSLKGKKKKIIPQNKDNLMILAGSLYWQPDNSPEICNYRKTTQRSLVEVIKFQDNITEHSAYPNLFIDDIALIRTLSRFSMNEQVKPIVFIVGSIKFQEVKNKYLIYQKSNMWKKCFVVGWGLTNPQYDENKTKILLSERSESLNVMHAKYLYPEICSQYWCSVKKSYCGKLDFRLSNFFCARAVRGSAPCKWDTGSPYVCDGKVIGMLVYVDQSLSCGMTLFPDLYISGAKIFEFLKDNHLETMILYSRGVINNPLFLMCVIPLYNL